MLLFTVVVAAMAIVSTEAGVMKQQQMLDLQSDHGSVDWRPHLPANFRSGFSRPIDQSPLVEDSQIDITNEEASHKPVKNGEKKKAYIQNAALKVSTHQQPHSRSKRFILPKQKFRVIAVPLSVFNFLGFLPVRIPGLPFHQDLPGADYIPYRTSHDSFPLRQRRKSFFKKY